MTAHIEMVNAAIRAPGGRCLFEGLNLRLPAARVALVGRNGVGKSLLLATLAGERDPERGTVTTRGHRCFVPQELTPRAARAPTSNGERRRRALTEAARSGADILLLDEPTEDLDDAGLSWLRQWLCEWPGCLLVASHDRRLLADFRHFFVASESGCRYFGGTLAELEEDLAAVHDAAERRYAHRLAHLVSNEEHTTVVARRRARKKRSGRVRELDRATPKIRLNQKRSQAQVYQGRFARIREERLHAVREWSKAARRALAVTLALALPRVELPEEAGDTLVLHDVTASIDGRELFTNLSLRLGRRRIAVVGPNGSGKTTLLDVLLGKRLPSSGSVSRDLTKIGAIAQGGADWALEESLLARLQLEASSRSIDDAARLLVAHQFPLALAARPMSSLSPGERARAALLCLLHRQPPVELLVLDEPTHALDLLGQRALIDALRAWPGGLVVTSHDPEFLGAVGFDECIELGTR